MDTLTHALLQEVATRATELRWRLASAESCTGGLLAGALTTVAGASDWFERGWVTYSNLAKHEELGVAQALLDECGAVSESVVQAMAKGAVDRTGVDLAVAISGVAGPSGATPEKPLGTVCFAVAGGDENRQQHYTLQFDGDRDTVRAQAVDEGLRALLRWMH